MRPTRIRDIKMKKTVRLSVLLAVMCIAVVSFSSCKKDDVPGGGKSTKLSPPSWLHGSWGVEGLGMEIFKVTSNDVIYMGVSLKDMYNITTVAGSVSLKETKNTSSIYELTYKASAGGERASAIFSFKKGDGTYIDIAINEAGETFNESDYAEFVKLK